MSFSRRFRTSVSSVLILVVCISGCGRGTSNDGAASMLEGKTLPQNYEWFIFLAGPLGEPQSTGVKQELQRLVAKVARPSDVIHVISAPEHAPIATFKVPDAVQRARLRECAAAFQKVAKFLAAASGGSSAGNQVQAPAIPSTVLALRRTAFPIQVLVAGNPIYQEDRQAGWSFAGGYVPTDASLGAKSCPFGNGVGKLPEGTQVRWLTPTANWGADTRHRTSVIRFYQLFFKGIGAHLIRATPDAAAAFSFDGAKLTANVEPDSSTEPRMQLVSRGSSREEQNIPDQSVDVEVGNERVGESIRTDDETDSNAGLLRLLDKKNHTTLIGIAWDTPNDKSSLDLRIGSKGFEDVLSRDKPEVEFGHRDAKRVSLKDGFRCWEWAEIHHDRIEDLSIAVQTLSSDAPKRARMVVVWKGTRHEFDFELSELQSAWDRLRSGESLDEPSEKASDTQSSKSSDPDEVQEPPKCGFLGIKGTKAFYAGVAVRYLFEGSGAQKAGVQIGDNLCELDGHPIVGMKDLIRLVKERRAGQEVVLQLLRDGKDIEVRVTLGEWPRDADSDAR